MNIIFTIFIIALLMVLVPMGIKKTRIFSKMSIWVIIAALIAILVNYILLPNIGREPLKLGLEKVYREENDKAEEQMGKYETQRDKILGKITPKTPKAQLTRRHLHI